MPCLSEDAKQSQVPSSMELVTPTQMDLEQEPEVIDLTPPAAGEFDQHQALTGGDDIKQQLQAERGDPEPPTPTTGGQNKLHQQSTGGTPTSPTLIEKKQTDQMLSLIHI